MAGRTVTRRRGHGVEIDDIRPWLPGDDVRHIDRNATARTGVPHVRTWRDERQRTVLLLADFRPSMLFGTKRVFRSVAAGEALALTGWRIVKSGGRAGLLTAGTSEPVFVRPAHGERAMTAVIAGMARAHEGALESGEKDDPPLDRLVERGMRCMPRGGLLILATALESAGDSFDDIVRPLARRRSLRIVFVTDAFERAPPPGFYPYLTSEGRRNWGTVGWRRKASFEDARWRRLLDLDVRAIRVDAEIAPENNRALLEWIDAVSA